VTRFSERIGVQTMPRQIQLETMDDALRNSLWNALLDRFHAPQGQWTSVANALAKYLYKIPVDTVPDTEGGARKWTREQFFGAEWYMVYDVVEFVVQNVDFIKKSTGGGYYVGSRYYRTESEALLAEMNVLLERELSGYRFIAGVLAPITDAVEIAALEGAASAHGESSGAAVHIRAALSMLGQKPTPDYRNSIKESVSAVESVVNLIAGTDESGVAKAIEVLATRTEIHPALRAALKQLYGYSSDADGIRHAILEQTEVGFAEAKFMLVTCSAFVNFIVEKGQ
jgi:hypothetical protein